jgi:uncharacterized protein
MLLPGDMLHAERRLQRCCDQRPATSDQRPSAMRHSPFATRPETMNDSLPATAAPPTAASIVERLGLLPHPEGGWYRERFRSLRRVQPLVAGDARPARSALTTIDFLLAAGQFSAWHRVRSDEVWHLLEGGPLRLWTWAASADRVHAVELAAGVERCHVVEADVWQAAEPLGAYALCGATVGPGFDFADFEFGRDDAALRDALARLAPELQRLL